MAAVQADGQQHPHNERIGTVISQIRVHDRIGRPLLTEGHPARKRTQTSSAAGPFAPEPTGGARPGSSALLSRFEAEQRSTPAPTGSFL